MTAAARELGGRGIRANAVNPVAFLLSPDGAWTTGQLIHTDGGFSS